MPLKIFLSFNPPASMIGSLIWSNSTEDQSNVFPVPPTRFLSYESSSNAETLYELKIDLFKLGFNGIALITGISNDWQNELDSLPCSWMPWSSTSSITFFIYSLSSSTKTPINLLLELFLVIILAALISIYLELFL